MWFVTVFHPPLSYALCPAFISPLDAFLELTFLELLVGQLPIASEFQEQCSHSWKQKKIAGPNQVSKEGVEWQPCF
jgi:hypothetical protein